MNLHCFLNSFDRNRKIFLHDCDRDLMNLYCFSNYSDRNREFTLFDYHIIPIVTDNNKQYMQNNPTSMTIHIIHIYTHNYYLFKA